MTRRSTYTINVELPVGTDIEQAAGGVIRTGDKRVTIGEELNGVDVRLVCGKGLDGLSCTDIPQLGKRITSARDEGVLVGRVKADAHDLHEVGYRNWSKGDRVRRPSWRRHVARGGKDAAVVDEATAGKVAGMTRKLTRNACGPVTLLVEIVDGANVVETTTCDEVAGRGVCASHDP